jgi:hypothetical protein
MADERGGRQGRISHPQGCGATPSVTPATYNVRGTTLMLQTHPSPLTRLGPIIVGSRTDDLPDWPR